MTVKIEKKHIFIVGAILILLIALIVGVNIYSTHKYKKNAIEFKARTTALTMPMALVLEDYQKNWRSAIFDHEAYDETGASRYCSDFNTALGWRITAHKKVLSLIDLYFFDIKDLMKDMDNPPSKYEKVHDKFLAIYKNLNKLKNLCNSPEGSLQSFSSNVNNLLSDIHSDLKETDLTIESDSKMMSKYIDEFTESLETIRKVQKD